MRLFNKRPLGLVLFILLSGFSIFALGSVTFKTVALCAVIAMCPLSFFIKKFSGRIVKISCFTLLISFILSHTYFNYMFYPSEYFDRTVKIVGCVQDVEVKSDTYRIVDLKTVSINGESESFLLKVNLYGDYTDVEPGAVVEMEAELGEFESDASFDFKQFYTSGGFSASADTSYVKIVDIDTVPLSYRLSQLRGRINERGIRLLGYEAGSMLGALLLGERDLLSDQVRLDFQRIGITHILSLSGMHVTILMGGLDRLLYLLRVKRTPRLLLGCLGALIFMALTGFPLTVCRAGIMLIISSLLFVITGSKDSVTSLFIAAALIMLITPYAALDIGLWLSVIATLGILVAAETVGERYSEDTGVKKLAVWLKTSLLFSLFAISASALISVLSFSGVSAISVLSTLLFSVLVELFVYLGIAVLLFGEIIPLATPLCVLSDTIYGIAARLSDLPFIYGSTEFIAVKISFIALCVAFALFAVLNIKRRRLFIGALFALFCISTVLSIGLTEIVKEDDLFVSYNDGSEKILIRSGGKTLLYDASSHRKSDGYMNNAILADANVTELDFYMLASYSSYSPDSIRVVLSNQRVRNVLLPIAQNSEENAMALEIFEILGGYRTELGFYGDTEIFKLGEYQILTPFRDGKNESFATTFMRDGEIYSYLSSGILEYVPRAAELLYVSRAVIFGDYGTSYTKARVVDEFSDRLEIAVVYDDKVYFSTESCKETPPEIYRNCEAVVIYD